MIKLAMLLVGAQALRRRWAVLATLGLFWMALGLAIMVDASDGVSVVTTEAFAILLLFEGLIALSSFTLAPRRAGYLVLFKALALILLALMILDFPIQVDLERSLLFGLAFLIDGAVRIATAAVVRFPKWQVSAAGGALEVGLGALALSNWPVSHHQTVPFCIGVALLLSGWTVLRLGLMLRRLGDHTAGAEPAGVRPARLVSRRRGASRRSGPRPRCATRRRSWCTSGRRSARRRTPSVASWSIATSRRSTATA